MEELFSRIIDALLPMSDLYLYAFLFVSAIVENLFPPIPGDMITVFGAFLVGTGRLNYALVYLTTTMGSVAGFMGLYAVGRFLGKEFFIERDYRFFSAKSIIAAEIWFLRHGSLVILANRFLPGVRSVISIVSGITGLPALTAAFYAFISASVWNLIWIHTGFLLGNNWSVVREKISLIFERYNIAVTALLGASAVLFFIYKKYMEKKEAASADPPGKAPGE
jgi:membrane protein DedA with SNARE-associated domain